MADDPTDAVREGLARGLARFAAQPRLGDGTLSALAESEGSAWFGIADNARAAEILAHPLLWDAHAALGTELFDFLLALTEAGAPPRRVGPAKLRVEDESGHMLRVATTSHLFYGDLSRGEIRQVPRGDPEVPPAALHGGNLVEFTYRGRRHCLDVEDAIVAHGAERQDGGIGLYHESRVLGRGRFGKRREVGRLRYSYEIRADSPTVALTVRFTASAPLSRVRVTTACDSMSPGQGVDFATMLLGGRRRSVPAGQNVTLHEGPLEGIACLQDRAPLRALTLAIAMPDGAQVLNVKTSAAEEGRLHWLLTRYARDGLGPGETFTIREERTLLRGGTGERRLRGQDATPCSEPALVLNAIAMHLLMAGTGRYRRAPDSARLAVLHQALRRQLARWQAGLRGEDGNPDPRRAGCGDLAAGMMALECLWRLGGDAALRDAMDQALELMLALQRTEELTPRVQAGAFRDLGSAPPSLAEHAAAMLALARRALVLPDPRLGPALRNALAALRLASGVGEAGPADGIALHSQGEQAAGHETQSLAMLLRALRALQAARAAEAITLDEASARRAAFLAELCTTLLQSRIQPRGDALAADRTSAAQATALAALLPPDAVIARVTPPETAANAA